jgi:23S rRNA-/tRNA-specific pseudouridylate synthase
MRDAVTDAAEAGAVPGAGPEPPRAVLAREELERRILYERGGVVVVDKPPGIPTSGLQLDEPGSLQFALIERQRAMTWAVHQLDAGTSGCNVFVAHKRLVPRWQRRMRHPRGTKTYLAVVRGEVAFRDLLIDQPLGVVEEGPPRQLGITPSGRPARSRVRALACANGCSLLRVQIETGRTHQIRIHLAAIGHPLLGEPWYGGGPCDRHPRQALHAWRLDFDDGEAPQSLCSPVPEDLVALLRELGLPCPE